MSWEADMDRAIADISRSVLKERNALFRDVCDEIVQRTPVDTGALKGSWHFTKDAPSTDTEPRIDADGYAPMLEVDLLLPTLPGDGTAYLTNNLDYATEIEYDRKSKLKSPEGMVRVTLERYMDGG